MLASCKTYYIPKGDFVQQFRSIDSSDLNKVTLMGAANCSYLANPIQTIRCQDKNGNPAALQNSPSIEIRFTYGEKNKKSIFYFDRIFLEDTLIFGTPSRILPMMIQSVPLNSVTKIEVQDGKKNYRYVDASK